MIIVNNFINANLLKALSNRTRNHARESNINVTIHTNLLSCIHSLVIVLFIFIIIINYYEKMSNYTQIFVNAIYFIIHAYPQVNDSCPDICN